MHIMPNDGTRVAKDKLMLVNYVRVHAQIFIVDFMKLLRIIFAFNSGHFVFFYPNYAR